jgi:hypothetical protein
LLPGQRREGRLGGAGQRQAGDEGREREEKTHF